MRDIINLCLGSSVYFGGGQDFVGELVLVSL